MIEFNKSIETLSSSKSKKETPSIEIPSTNKFNQPKHLCIRLATGPQYHS
jgi:hypothetical protein